MSKFDAIRTSGDMMPTAMGTPAMDGKTEFFFRLIGKKNYWSRRLFFLYKVRTQSLEGGPSPSRPS